MSRWVSLVVLTILVTGCGGNAAGGDAQGSFAGGTGGPTSAAGTGSTISDGDPEDHAAAAPIVDDTWNVIATVNAPTTVSDCSQISFVLGFSGTGADLSLVVGRDGEGYVAPITVSNDQFDFGSGTLQLPARVDCGVANSVYLKTLNLSRRDGRLVGSATGELRFDHGYFYKGSYDVTVNISGVLDDTPPALISAIGDSPLSPVDSPRLLVSEPLRSSTLSWMGTSTALVSGAAPLVELKTGELLPFGGSWQLTGEAVDLAGHSLPLGQTVTTIPDPGVFLNDGFEAEIFAKLNGEARVIDASEGLPIPAGQRALFVKSSGSGATLHLRREHSEQFLVFKVVTLRPAAAGGGPELRGNDVRVGIIGAPSAQGFACGAVEDRETGHSQWSRASAVTEVRQPLLGTGTDVCVEFQPTLYGTSIPYERALIIDDLRLE